MRKVPIALLDDVEEECEIIEIVGNDIYFYASINKANIFKLIKCLHTLDEKSLESHQ